MAFRAALSRASKSRAWRSGHHQLFKVGSGISGPIISSSNKRSAFAQNFSFNSRCLSIPSRHYYLPPPPSVEVSGVTHSFGGVSDLSNRKEALSLAEFAVMMHNETEDRNIGLVRVVRASQGLVAGYDYYLTLEGIDDNGDLNVYYAEVNVLGEITQLRKWQLVDESFSYPFSETSKVEQVAKKIQPGIEGDRNLVRAWLSSMTLRYYDRKAESLNSEEIVVLNSDSCFVYPSYDMVDCGKIVKYALFALEVLNEKGKKICLKEVLHARKELVDAKVFYILLLKAMNSEKEFVLLHAILEVLQAEGDLIKCHVVDELLSDGLKS